MFPAIEVLLELCSNNSMSELMKRRAEIETRIEAAEAAWLEASEALEEFAA